MWGQIHIIYIIIISASDWNALHNHLYLLTFNWHKKWVICLECMGQNQHDGTGKYYNHFSGFLLSICTDCICLSVSMTRFNMSNFRGKQISITLVLVLPVQKYFENQYFSPFIHSWTPLGLGFTITLWCNCSNSQTLWIFIYPVYRTTLDWLLEKSGTILGTH